MKTAARYILEFLAIGGLLYSVHLATNGSIFQKNSSSEQMPQQLKKEIKYLRDKLSDAKTDQMELMEIQRQEEENQKIGQYAINMMYAVGADKKMSKGRMQVLARGIVRVANDIFSVEANKKAIIMVLAIESSFNRFAQSPTGPKGYGQLSKAAFKDAMSLCGMTDLRDEDVWEQDLNLYAAACYYKKLLNDRDGDTYAAAVAYNQGPNSASDKMYRKNGKLKEIEPIKYLEKFSFLERRSTTEQSKGVPAVSDLPIPTPPTKQDS